MSKDIRCNNCLTFYTEDELTLLPDGSGGWFKGCDVCETDDYLMDMEEEE